MAAGFVDDSLIAAVRACIQGSQGQLCGGFSDVPWGKTGGRGRYIPSEKAFLFTLINNADQPPTKFDIVKKMFAISHHPE